MGPQPNNFMETDLPRPKGLQKSIPHLGGWLIVVGIGLFAAPLRICVQALGAFLPLFQDNTWASISTPGIATYRPILASMIVIELTLNVALILASIVLIVLFFSKRRIFPKLFIWVTLGSLGIIVLDAVAMYILMPERGLLSADTSHEIARSLLVALVWVPYMMVSRRVRATFVN